MIKQREEQEKKDKQEQKEREGREGIEAARPEGRFDRGDLEAWGKGAPLMGDKDGKRYTLVGNQYQPILKYQRWCIKIKSYTDLRFFGGVIRIIIILRTSRHLTPI